MNQEFKDIDPVMPPARILSRLQETIHHDLKLTPWRVFSKLAGVHLISALLTLSVCPQFGMRVAGKGMGLMEMFMHLGTYGCMIACGFFFVGMSLVLAALLLKPFELLAIRRHRLAEIGSLVLLSLGFFAMAAPEEILFGLALAWAIGAMAGGFLILEFGWRVRRHGIA